MSSLNQEVAQILDAQRESLANAVVAQHYALEPELEQRYGEKGRIKCLQDANYHLTYLSEAIATTHPSLFANYIAWAKVLLTGIGIPSSHLAKNIEILSDVFKKELPENVAVLIQEYIEAGLTQLPELPFELPTFIPEYAPHAELAQRYLNALLKGERNVANRLVLDAVENGVSVKDIYLHVFQRSQYEIGRLWQINQVSVAQEHFCTAATQFIMSQLYPHIFTTARKNRVLVATCIGGDLHEIGVRMVADFFEMDGWDTYYLGANTPNPSVLQALAERKADVLAISATMMFHVRAVKELIAAVRSNDDFENIKIAVGGYPFNVEPTLWKQMGADTYASDANQAVQMINKLILE